MASRSNLKLAELIRFRAAHVILHELKDPRMGFVTITRVKLAPDNSACVIFWSVLGDDGQRSKTAHALESARLFVQHRVAEGLRTRNAPQLSFEFDDSVEGAIRMGGLLKQLRDVRGDEAPAEGATPGSEASSAPGEGGEDETDEADESDEADEADEADEDSDDSEDSDSGDDTDRNSGNDSDSGGLDDGEYDSE